MALNSIKQYTGNGVTTDFVVPPYLEQDDISVFLDGVEQTLGTDFTFTTAGDEIRFGTAPATSVNIRVARNTDLVNRAVDFSDGSVLTEKDLDDSNIQVFYAAQEAIDKTTETMAVADDNKFDAQNKVIKNVADPVNANDAVNKNWAETSMSSQLAQAIEARTGAETAETNAEASELSAANSASSASTSASTATTKAAQASISETNAANSATSAATSATNAATSESNAASSASSASSSATSASTSASTATAQAAVATTKASEAASSATSATNSASTATTKASEASASANSAATSATSAGNSATNAQTSATNAASSATSAGTSATSALSSKNAAATSETNAAASATAAASSATDSANSATASATSATQSAASATAAAQSATEAAASAASIDPDNFVAVAGDTMTGNLNFGDNDKAIFGAGSDLQISHNGSNSLILDLGDGALYLGGNEEVIITNGGATEYKARFVSNGTSELYYDNSKKLATTSTGVNVTGTLEASRGIGNTNTDTTNSGSVTLDFATNQNFVLTLTGNVTLANPTTEAVGQSGFIVFIQDATGSRTLSLGTDYETAGGAGITLSTAANATDVVPYIVAASGRILLGTPQKGFA